MIYIQTPPQSSISCLPCPQPVDVLLMVSDYELTTRHKCNDTHLSSHTLITDTEYIVTLLQPRHPPAASAWWCGRWWPHSSDSWRCVYRGLAPAACSPCSLHLIMAASGIEDNFVKTLHLWLFYLIGRGNAIEPKIVRDQMWFTPSSHPPLHNGHCCHEVPGPVPRLGGTPGRCPVAGELPYQHTNTTATTPPHT